MKKILLLMLLGVMFIGVVSADFPNANGTYTWVPNNTINASLPNLNVNSHPSVFYKDSSLYMISGARDGNFYGYVYNGTNWLTNLTINNSLPIVNLAEGYSNPSVFYKDSSWYLISGTWTRGFLGYVWNGTQWNVNLTINNSLPIVNYVTGNSVFYKDSSWYLISGNTLGTISGYTYNGTNWISNSTITNDLLPPGSDFSPDIFYKDGSWYAIIGAYPYEFYGYVWNGTSWATNNTINASLFTTNAPPVTSGYIPSPFVFNISSNWYLISGELFGTFYGFSWTKDTISPSISFPFYANLSQKSNSSTLNLNISLNDSLSGLYGSYCLVEANGTNTTFQVINNWCNGTISLTNLGGGNHVINVYANDSSGNVGLNNSYYLNIPSASKPAITINSPVGVQTITNISFTLQ